MRPARRPRIAFDHNGHAVVPDNEVKGDLAVERVLFAKAPDKALNLGTDDRLENNASTVLEANHRLVANVSRELPRSENAVAAMLDAIGKFLSNPGLTVIRLLKLLRPNDRLHPKTREFGFKDELRGILRNVAQHPRIWNQRPAIRRHFRKLQLVVKSCEFLKIIGKDLARNQIAIPRKEENFLTTWDHQIDLMLLNEFAQLLREPFRIDRRRRNSEVSLDRSRSSTNPETQAVGRKNRVPFSSESAAQLQSNRSPGSCNENAFCITVRHLNPTTFYGRLPESRSHLPELSDPDRFASPESDGRFPKGVFRQLK